MKKAWNDPKFEELNIKETAGGPVFSDKPDSDYYQDDKGWHRDFGTTISGGK